MSCRGALRGTFATVLSGAVCLWVTHSHGFSAGRGIYRLLLRKHGMASLMLNYRRRCPAFLLSCAMRLHRP
jgi:hypothetical protein